MINRAIFIILCALPFFVLLKTQSCAGCVKIINENKKVIQIIIQSEGMLPNEKRGVLLRIIPPKGELTLELNEQELNGNVNFFVSGEVNKFIFTSTCAHLTTFNNYKIIFKDDLVGTTCEAQKLTMDKMAKQETHPQIIYGETF
jgi:hypothetical protein